MRQRGDEKTSVHSHQGFISSAALFLGSPNTLSEYLHVLIMAFFALSPIMRELIKSISPRETKTQQDQK